MRSPGVGPDASVSLVHYARQLRGPLLLGVLALIIVNIFDLALPLILGRAIDALVVGASAQEVGPFALIYLSLALMQAGCRFAWRVSLNRAGISVAQEVRERIASPAVRAVGPDGEAGRVVALVSSDAENVGRLYDSGMMIVIDALFGLIGVPVILIWYDPHLALLTLAPLPMISVAVFIFDRLIKERCSVGQEQLGKMSALVEELLGRVRAVKVNTAESAFLSRFTKISSEYLIAARKLTATESIFGPCVASALTVSLVTLLSVGGGQVIAGSLTLGTFVAFQRYLERLLWPMHAIALALTTFKKSSVSAERIANFLRSSAPPPQRNATPHPEATLLELSNVTVSRGESNVVVGDVSLSIRDGEKIALVGPTGGGKSTLAWAIGGLSSDATRQGEILLRGVDVSQLGRAQVSTLIALVPQEVFLFGMSIRDNLLLGLPDGAAEASEAELFEALEIAGISEEIRSLPDGIDTVLGERGLSLSGGQRQRLTLARAIVRRPALLVLDNALSAVDAATEARIVERLTSLGCALLCVTHRLSTAQAMSRIVVLERGQKTQDGPRDLVAADEGGWFRSFCDHQRAEAELQRYA